MRLLARKSLERTGFRVREAADGEQVLAKFAEAAPELVLLDVQMPRMDGFTACRRLRALPAGKHTPIMMMTGLDDLGSIQRAYEEGATDFVNKPVNWLVLGHRLEYMLRASRAAERLRDSQTKLANAQRIAKLGYWEWHEQGDRLFCSRELCQIFGVSVASGLRTLEELVQRAHDEDREALRDAVDRFMDGKDPGEVEFRIPLPDGSQR